MFFKIILYYYQSLGQILSPRAIKLQYFIFILLNIFNLNIDSKYSTSKFGICIIPNLNNLDEIFIGSLFILFILFNLILIYFIVKIIYFIKEKKKIKIDKVTSPSISSSPSSPSSPSSKSSQSSLNNNKSLKSDKINIL